MATAKRSLPAAIGKKAKRAAGRTGAASTPLNLRTHGVDIDDDFEEYVRAKAGQKLGRLARRIERVTVRLEDINGPKGGVDVECRIKVVVAGGPSVIMTERATEPVLAFDAALGGATRALKKT
ncbi:MAG TPA: HPF/RaiA family ribosome-associated protein [Kofleriaceae bacterium]|nr:HPF/RaiA family ribosome-associated protein [Kofleriaceae bacterium]